MPATDAQIAANRKNALLSSGPKTEVGKAASRRNALKHGLTAEVVIPQEEAAEVERKFRVMKAEMRPSSELAEDLVRDIATTAVRMRRCQVRESAHLTERVRRAIDEFVPPEGASDEEVEELRAEAADIALFDPSAEAERARKYEAAARRGFYRAIKEFRQVEREAASTPFVETARPDPGLGSFSKTAARDTPPATRPAETIRKPPMPAGPSAPDPSKSTTDGVSFIPIAVGKPR